NPGEKDILWEPEKGIADTAPLEGITAVVNLMGENIAGGRLDAEHLRRVTESRVPTTRRLCEALARMKKPPAVLVSASGISYYGDCGEELLTEDSPLGDSRLAEVCRQWEEATAPARDAGIRVVLLRTAVILTPAGGALRQML